MPLKGLRILVVEDEALVAVMLEDMLVDLGAEVIGPAATIEQGLALAAGEALDAAVLDVNIRGGSVSALASLLRQRSVPIVFATGYGKAPPGHEHGAPVLTKPYRQQDLEYALSAALARRPR